MKKFYSALSFLTLIPAHPFSYEDLKKSSHYFPIIGLIIGSILCLIYFLLNGLFSKYLIISFIVFIEVVITRGLHIDGFADFFDGFFGGKTREEKLRIMKDYSNGSFGTASLIFLILFKIQLFNLFSNPEIYAVLLLTPVLSRWVILYPILKYPYAKETGLGRIFKLKISEFIVISLIVILLSSLFLSFYGMILITLLFLITKIIVDYITKVIGGMTGDVYGFFIELSQLLIPLLLFLLIQIIKYPIFLWLPKGLF